MNKPVDSSLYRSSYISERMGTAVSVCGGRVGGGDGPSVYLCRGASGIKLVTYGGVTVS